jgi:hypothetical protein
MGKNVDTYVVLKNINILLMPAGLLTFIEICQINYLNKLVEQGAQLHLLKLQSCDGLQSFHSAKAAIGSKQLR